MQHLKWLYIGIEFYKPDENKIFQLCEEGHFGMSSACVRINLKLASIYLSQLLCSLLLNHLHILGYAYMRICTYVYTCISKN